MFEIDSTSDIVRIKLVWKANEEQPQKGGWRGGRGRAIRAPPGASARLMAPAARPPGFAFPTISICGTYHTPDYSLGVTPLAIMVEPPTQCTYYST
ncbi:hypothetical protein EVAR_83960_1 [Eumeta japonica]|uniref:Uncharacterized protein n=1 Tax=Eumeta variegata TaxID=151549 RepID=A0A4C1VP05_EUMVA|nr:hypothetical protein EVAR_83960_1 [Eumeta japonica]